MKRGTRRRDLRRGGCRGLAGSFGIVLGFILLFAIAGGLFFWRAVTTPYKGFDGASVRIEIKKGSNTSRIMKRLRKDGVLRDDFVPLIYMKLLRRGDSLKAGIYEFAEASSPIAVIDKIVSGDVVQKTVTIPEGFDRFSIGQTMASNGFGTEKDWLKLTSDPELIRDVSPEAESLEGYLYPDTYKLAPGTNPRAIVELMIRNFRRNFAGEMGFFSNGLSLHETVTLASIVETEARLDQERPIVASVYLNRTRKKMPLQADPTVIYAMKLNGTWNGNIRREDLRNDSPYNTYVRRGFPPGPIANPGLPSLKAAASPQSSGFYYFVARSDGSHVFSRDLAEHNRNVAFYQKGGAKRGGPPPRN